MDMEASTSTTTSPSQQQPGVAASTSALPLLAPKTSAPPSCSIPDSGHSTPQRGTGGGNNSNTCSMRPSPSVSVSAAAARLSSAARSLRMAAAAAKERGSGSGGSGSGSANAAASVAVASKGSSPPLLTVVSASGTSGGGAPASSCSTCSPKSLRGRRPRTLAKLLLVLLAVAALVNALSCGSPICKGRNAKAGSEKALASLRAIYNLRGTPGSWGVVLSGAWPGSGGGAGGGGSGDKGGGGGGVAPATAAATSSSSSSSSSVPATDLLIPRIIHQTYRSEAELPAAAARLMLTWRAKNPTWEVRFWDDADCLSFVETEFPQWAPAYRALPKDVERSDFFRYLVVLRYGGVYADVDTECRAPLDELLLPTDTLVVGWENEFSTASRAAARKYVRKRQVLQWVFAGAPGHPALRAACEHVARNAWSTMSRAGNTDTLERTGPGAFTDAVLSAADAHAPARARSDPWSVRVAPKVTFGAHPRGLDGVDPQDPRVAVLHHYLGTWKSVRGWAPGGGLLGAAVAALLPGALAPKGEGAAPSPFSSSSGSSVPSSSVASRANAAAENASSSSSAAAAAGGGGGGGGAERSSGDSDNREATLRSDPLSKSKATTMEAALPFDSSSPRLYPVSLLATSSPPVTALVPLIGSAERVGGEDVAAALTVYGAWQPGGAPSRTLQRRAAVSGKSSPAPSSASSSSSSPFVDEPTPIEALLGGLDAATLASRRAAEAEEKRRERKRRRSEEQESSGGDGGGGGGEKNDDASSSSSSSSQEKKDNSKHNKEHHRAVLLDLGAGLGAASLAAAARGHRVVAAEAGPQNAAALRASALYNGFEDLIELHEVAVGSGSSGSGYGSSSGEVVVPSLACLDESLASSAGRWGSLFTDAARGYGARPPPKVVAAAASSSSSSSSSSAPRSSSSPASCLRTARRVHAASLVPPARGARVGAVRVSAPGWEDLVLDGLLRRLHSSSSGGASSSSSGSSPSPPTALPAVLLLELDVAALNAAAASAAAATPPSARARKLGPAEDEEEGVGAELRGREEQAEEEEEDSRYFVAEDESPPSTSSSSSTSLSTPRRSSPPPRSPPSVFPSLVGSDAPTLLAKLRSLGYVHVSHSGAACGARWRALARSLGLPPPGSAAARAAAKAEALLLTNGTVSAAAAAANASATNTWSSTSTATPAIARNHASGSGTATSSSSSGHPAPSTPSSPPSSPPPSSLPPMSSTQNRKDKRALPPGALAPPVWCRLPPSEVAAFERAAVSAKTAETVLLIHASVVEEEADAEFEEDEGEVEVEEQGGGV